MSVETKKCKRCERILPKTLEYFCQARHDKKTDKTYLLARCKPCHYAFIKEKDPNYLKKHSERLKKAYWEDPVKREKSLTRSKIYRATKRVEVLNKKIEMLKTK